MVNYFLAVCSAVLAFVFIVVAFPEGFGAVVTIVLFSAIIIAIIRNQTEDGNYLQQLFLAGLLLRLSFGIVIHFFDLRTFFGGDALGYNDRGFRLTEIWFGNVSSNDSYSIIASTTTGSGWGMNYLTGFIYTFTGRNILAAQSFCGVIGAATAPMVYFCANKIFNNKSVAKTAALLIAVYPAFVIWSSQLLKDGLIIFLLVLAMTMVLQLQEKINYIAIAALIFALFGILSLRFYIFYMAVVAVLGSFLVGTSNSPQAIIRRLVVLVLIGIGLTYTGALKDTNQDITEYTNLERIQKSRSGLTQTESGFGGDLDVSTTDGAITALPVGFVYLMLAPFPWQISNFRQAVTLPEMILWWSSIPFMLSGLWYTVRKRLRNSIAILIFSMMLTFGYSLFQGNVGTAYRQRTQIQVFLFMFTAVGWTLHREKKENNLQVRDFQRQRFRKQFQKRDQQRSEFDKKESNSEV